MAKIETTCVCGATWKAEDDDIAKIGYRMNEWLKIHELHKAPENPKAPEGNPND
jgi:hypothetical protein